MNDAQSVKGAASHASGGGEEVAARTYWAPGSWKLHECYFILTTLLWHPCYRCGDRFISSQRSSSNTSKRTSDSNLAENLWDVILMLSASYRLMCSNNWSPAGGSIWGDCGTFMMYSLVGDSSSLEVRPKALEVGLTSCFFSASWLWM